jgi:UDP:flavonoid glycosyltransferase YjiC (YdhE family)
MHAILVSAGSDGDVFPFIGLGTRLRSWGHQVTLFANEDYHTLAQEHTFGFHALFSQKESDELFTNPNLWHPTAVHLWEPDRAAVPSAGSTSFSRSCLAKLRSFPLTI